MEKRGGKGDGENQFLEIRKRLGGLTIVTSIKEGCGLITIFRSDLRTCVNGGRWVLSYFLCDVTKPR